MSCLLLNATCKLYECFVATAGSTDSVSYAEIARRTSAVRNSLRPTMLLIQKLCLSTKRVDFFPAFLSAIIATCSAILFVDITGAVPPSLRDLIWGDLYTIVSGMRAGAYDLLVDLLRASTNGFNPVRQQQSWAVGNSNNQEAQNNELRQVLLGDDPAAKQGLIEVKAWYEKHKSTLEEGRNMMNAGAYAAARVAAIGSLCKIFDF